jgi:hypothetical protein
VSDPSVPTATVLSISLSSMVVLDARRRICSADRAGRVSCS